MGANQSDQDFGIPETSTELHYELYSAYHLARKRSKSMGHHSTTDVREQRTGHSAKLFSRVQAKAESPVLNMKKPVVESKSCVEQVGSTKATKPGGKNLGRSESPWHKPKLQLAQGNARRLSARPRNKGPFKHIQGKRISRDSKSEPSRHTFEKDPSRVPKQGTVNSEKMKGNEGSNVQYTGAPDFAQNTSYRERKSFEPSSTYKSSPAAGPYEDETRSETNPAERNRPLARGLGSPEKKARPVVSESKLTRQQEAVPTAASTFFATVIPFFMSKASDRRLCVTLSQEENEGTMVDKEKTMPASGVNSSLGAPLEKLSTRCKAFAREEEEQNEDEPDDQEDGKEPSFPSEVSYVPPSILVQSNASKKADRPTLVSKNNLKRKEAWLGPLSKQGSVARIKPIYGAEGKPTLSFSSVTTRPKRRTKKPPPRIIVSSNTDPIFALKTIAQRRSNSHSPNGLRRLPEKWFKPDNMRFVKVKLPTNTPDPELSLLQAQLSARPTYKTDGIQGLSALPVYGKMRPKILTKSQSKPKPTESTSSHTLDEMVKVNPLDLMPPPSLIPPSFPDDEPKTPGLSLKPMAYKASKGSSKDVKLVSVENRKENRPASINFRQPVVISTSKERLKKSMPASPKKQEVKKKPVSSSLQQLRESPGHRHRSASESNDSPVQRELAVATPLSSSSNALPSPSASAVVEPTDLEQSPTGDPTLYGFTPFNRHQIARYISRSSNNYQVKVESGPPIIPPQSNKSNTYVSSGSLRARSLSEGRHGLNPAGFSLSNPSNSSGLAPFNKHQIADKGQKLWHGYSNNSKKGLPLRYEFISRPPDQLDSKTDVPQSIQQHSKPFHLSADSRGFAASPTSNSSARPRASPAKKPTSTPQQLQAQARSAVDATTTAQQQEQQQPTTEDSSDSKQQGTTQSQMPKQQARPVNSVHVRHRP